MFSLDRSSKLICGELSEEQCQLLFTQSLLFKQLKNTSLESSEYKFSNTSLAYEILSQLDIYKPVDDAFFKDRTGAVVKDSNAFLGLVNDNEYCAKHRLYFTEHSDVLFKEINFILEWSPKTLIRSKVIPPVGLDAQPYINIKMAKEERAKPTYDLLPSINSFFTANWMFLNSEIGKHFSCLTQVSSQIPGSGKLARKDYIVDAINDYVVKFQNRPHCMNHEKFFPKSWILYKKDQCEEFFRAFNSLEYKQLKEEKTIVYIRKIGIGEHRGVGVQPVNEEEEADLRKVYKNGANCGKVDKNYVIQRYIYNPLLLNGNKFDFRMYLLIASTNPVIGYYHDGFLRVSLAAYDVTSDDKKVLLTNLALSEQIYADAKQGNSFEGRSVEELKLAQQWSLERLRGYLLEQGIISDPEWLDNYLRPEFKKAMVHLLRLSSPFYLENSSIYELYGVDFMLDTDLNLWFIEANSGPAFDGYSRPMEKFIIKMLQDHFEVVHGLLRSRMKRIVQFVNKLDENEKMTFDEDGRVVIKSLEQEREAFRRITRNYFEKEFGIKPTNGFSKIFDENLIGTKAYQGLIPEECLKLL